VSATRRLFTVLGASEATILPFFPLLLYDRGLSPAEIGLVLGAMALMSFIGNPIWGYVADRHLGAERAMVVSAGGAALFSLLLLPTHSTASFVVFACLFAAWRSPLLSLADVIALERLPAEEREGYGRIRLWLSLGWSAGALVWGAVLQTGSIELVPALYAAMSVLVAALAHFDLGGHPRRMRVQRSKEPSGRHRVPRALIVFFVSLFLVNAAFAATWNFLALRILDVGGGAFLVGLGASLQAAAEVPVMRASPRLARRVGQHGVFVVGCAFYAAVFLAWGFLSDAASISALRLLAGVGFALTLVGSVVIVDDLVPGRLRATGQAWAKGISFGLAPVAGTLIGGVLYEYAGATTMFVVSSVVAAAAAVLAWAAAAQARASRAALVAP
jgi:PPP family 3-phenylpropionic acid transporter